MTSATFSRADVGDILVALDAVLQNFDDDDLDNLIGVESPTLIELLSRLREFEGGTSSAIELSNDELDYLSNSVLIALSFLKGVSTERKAAWRALLDNSRFV